MGPETDKMWQFLGPEIIKMGQHSFWPQLYLMYDEQEYVQVEEYHVKYDGEESFIDPASIQGGKLSLNVKSENSKIVARIKYKGFEDWTNWISSEKPVSLL